MIDRRYLSQKQRAALCLKQDGRCTVCGNKLQPGNIEYDHTQALSHGGDNEADNWRAICAIPCHKEKTKADSQARHHVSRLAYGTPKRSPPMAGSRKSRWKRHMDGTVSER